MIIGTTPTHTFNVPFETDSIKSIRVVYAQNDEAILVKKTKDCVLDGKVVSVTLTQEDTFLFDHKSPVEIQLRVVPKSGGALASIPKKVGVIKCLEDVVIE